MIGFKNLKVIHLCRHEKHYGFGYSPLGYGGYIYCESCDKYVAFVHSKTYPKISKSKKSHL